jgi:hypothetical protein
MPHCLVTHQITGHVVFVIVSTERGMTCSLIDNPASSKICIVNHFVCTKSISDARINREDAGYRVKIITKASTKNL